MSEPEPTTALQRQGRDMVAAVNMLQVIDAKTFEQAAELSRAAAALIKRGGEVMDPICQATDNAHKVAVAQRAALLKPFQDVKRVAGERMAGWERELDRRRREEEERVRRERERLEAEAREAAAAEQRRLQALADQAAAAVAEQLAADGEPDLAGLVKAPVVPTPAPAPVYVPPVRVQAAPRSAGVAFRTTWSAKVDDLQKLVQAVAAGQVSLEALLPNQVWLNQQAVMQRDQLAIPGVAHVETRSTATRTAPANGVDW